MREKRVEEFEVAKGQVQ